MRVLLRSSTLHLRYAAPTLKPLVVAQWIRQLLWRCIVCDKEHPEHRVGPNTVNFIDTNLTTTLSHFTAACRVAFTPMPFPYAQMLKYVVIVYVYSSPFAYVATLGYATPVVAFVFSMVRKVPFSLVTIVAIATYVCVYRDVLPVPYSSVHTDTTTVRFF